MKKNGMRVSVCFLSLLVVGWVWGGDGTSENRSLPDWSKLVPLDAESGWDAQGRRNGLVAHYYRDHENWDGAWPDETSEPSADAKDHTFKEYKYSRVEPLVNHRFIRRGWFSVRWKGILHTNPKSEYNKKASYTFSLWADDGCRLVIDGKTVIDDWRPCAEDGPGAVREATVTLDPGEHKIQVEYFQGQSLQAKDRDPIKMYWSCKERRIPKQIVPASHLSHSRNDLQPEVPEQEVLKR